MANNIEGLNKLFVNYNEYKSGNISLYECIQNHSKICFNDLSSAAVSNFSDGYSKDATLNIFKYIVEVVDNGNLNALRRLRIDLFIEDVNLTIKKI